MTPLLTTSVTVPRPPVEVARNFQCPSCPEGFPSHALLAAHRVRVHGFVDAAVEYWRTNKGTCPFCLCVVREGSGHNGSSLHFTARPSKAWKAWSS